MSIPVGFGPRFDGLCVGDKIIYEGGIGEQHLKAEAEISDQVGWTGVEIRITKILEMGVAVPFKEGDTITAGPNEIYLLEE